MNAKQLCEEQKRLDDLMNRQAEKCGLVTDNIYPIRDGIADETGYLSSSLKVAWILKEPYDDFDSEGMPCGGGWSLPKDCFRKADAWRNNPVWQNIAYIMYGFKNHLTWHEIPYTRDEHSIINEILTVAWINANKMPSRTSSSNSLVGKKFNAYWKDVVLEQLKVYEPNAIIFGNTFDFMQDCFPGAEYVEAFSNKQVWYYRWNGKVLLSAYHPGRKGEEYVDALIAALHTAKAEIAGV